MSEHVLKPCPFCLGTEVKVKENGFGDYFVICKNCGGQTSDFNCETELGAIERWNTRTPADNGEVVGALEYASKEIYHYGIKHIDGSRTPCDCLVCTTLAKIKAVSLPVSDDFSKTVKTHETIEKIGRDGEI